MNKTQSKAGKIALNLLGFYIFSLSSIQVWTLPVFGSKIQPPEFIFLLIISWLTVNLKKIPSFKFQMNTMTVLLFGYVLMVILSVVFSKYSGAYLELFGLFYLLVLFYVIVYILTNFCDDIPAFIVKWFTYLGVFTAVLGIIGWTIYQFGTWTPLVRSGSTYYPYFGYVGRVQGLTLTPGMYITIISISIVLLSAKMLFKKALKWEFFALFIMLIAVFLTLSKSLVLLLVGLIYLLRKRYFSLYRNGVIKLTKLQKIVRFSLKSVSILLVIFVFFATHFIIVQKESGVVSTEMTPYIKVEKPLLDTENTALYLCIYGHLKETAIEIGLQNHLFGIGQGRFLQAIPEMKSAGIYPAHFEDADPHSTYFGALAELGWIGLFFILSLWLQVWRNANLLKDNSSIKQQWFLFGILACFLLVILESVSTDVLNFRHYWVLFGVYWAIYYKVTYY